MSKIIIPDPKILEYVTFQHDPTHDLMLKALDIVRDFIIEKNLIITGGMAIDFALKNKGGSLYDDKTLPDYDFFSSEHYIHAYELGMILCRELKDEKGEIPNISVIDALHVTTMKVRVNFIVVADITYIPDTIFDAMPTLSYNISETKKILFRHPHFQMIDQHKSLSGPYDNAPREVVLQRWDKDMKRFDMLYDHYKISGDDLDFSKFNEVKISDEILENNCVGGFAALFLLHQKTDDEVNIRLPEGEPLILYTYQIEDLAGIIMDEYKKNKIKYFNQFLDLLPPSIQIIVDNNGKEFKFILYDVSNKLITAEKHKKHWVSDTQVCMTYFLANYLFLSKLDIYKNAYCMLGKLIEEKIKLPTWVVYGINNIGVEHILQRIQTLSMNKEIPRIKVMLKPGRFYPSESNKCEMPIALNNFSYEDSPLFQINGIESKERQKNLSYYINPISYGSSSDSDNGD